MGEVAGLHSEARKIGRLILAMLVLLTAFVSVLPATLDSLIVPFISLSVLIILSEFAARGLELRHRWPLATAVLQCGLMLVLVAVVATWAGGGGSPHWAVAVMVLFGVGAWLPGRHALILGLAAAALVLVSHLGRPFHGFVGAYLLFWICCLLAAVLLGRLTRVEAVEESPEPIVDPLTGLDTELMLKRVIEREHHEALRYSRAYAVMRVRLADLKGLTARHGEAGGRRVLQVLGQTLSQLVRDSDALGRFGDDGFAVLLVEADRGAAEIAAKRITSVLAKLSVELEEDVIVRPEVISSYASHPADGHSVEEVITRSGDNPYRTRNAVE